MGDEQEAPEARIKAKSAESVASRVRADWPLGFRAIMLEAAALFRGYEAHHRAKSAALNPGGSGRSVTPKVTEALEKAERNAKMAGRIERLMALPPGWTIEGLTSSGRRVLVADGAWADASGGLLLQSLAESERACIVVVPDPSLENATPLSGNMHASKAFWPADPSVTIIAPPRPPLDPETIADLREAFQTDG